MAQWNVIFGTALVAFFFYITWGAWQGYFSPVLPPPEDPRADELQKETQQLKTTIQAAKETIFQHENDTSELLAKIADLQRQVQTLMDEINNLTSQIAALQDENATLRKGLKEALEQLDICRKQLMICKTQLDAKRLEKQYCDIQPSSNLLL
ncbi:MAG: hypothetical protein ACO35C_05365 [Pontimonas sp.]